jgi:A/G-specific adenine glycosylase
MGDISSLGLSWRGRLMHEMARYIVEECDSQIPSSKEGLLKLPGVGPYIASALMCFIYEKPEPVLDTNTVRVIGRLHGIRISDSSRRSKKFESIMRSYLDTNTVRVIGRLHGIRISDSSRRSKKFESIMRSYLKYGRPRDFSLSLIDLAALVCTSSESPHCEICPVGEWCCRCREIEGGGIT